MTQGVTNVVIQISTEVKQFHLLLLSIHFVLSEHSKIKPQIYKVFKADY